MNYTSANLVRSLLESDDLDSSLIDLDTASPYFTAFDLADVRRIILEVLDGNVQTFKSEVAPFLLPDGRTQIIADIWFRMTDPYKLITFDKASELRQRIKDYLSNSKHVAAMVSLPGYNALVPKVVAKHKLRIFYTAK